MKYLSRLTTGILLAAFGAFAESKPHTYTGEIVNGKCLQAAQIINRNSRGYVPRGASAFTPDLHNPLNPPRMRGSILRHCSVNPGSTEFALLDESGNFFRLDEPGNFQVLLKTRSTDKRVRVSITGSVDRDTLYVESLKPMTDVSASEESQSQ